MLYRGIHHYYKRLNESNLKMNKITAYVFLFLLVAIASGLFYGSSSSGDENDMEQDSTKLVARHYSIVPVKIPDEIYFADERVPVENFDTYESLDRELLINIYWQSQTLIFLKKANKYFPTIERIFSKDSIPSDLKYIAVAESGLSNIISPSNAVGFWQFLQGTATDADLEVNDEVDERYHLEKSTEAAAKFLKGSYEKYGSWAMAAASYNMGRRNLSRQVDRQKTDYYYDLVLGDETGRYIFRLIALKLIMESPEKYGFYITDEDKYPEVPYHTVMVDSSVQSWADFAHQMGINYKVLKELNPWLREDKLTNKNHKQYQIKIASDKYRKIRPNPKFYPE